MLHACRVGPKNAIGQLMWSAVVKSSNHTMWDISFTSPLLLTTSFELSELANLLGVAWLTLFWGQKSSNLWNTKYYLPRFNISWNFYCLHLYLELKASVTVPVFRWNSHHSNSSGTECLRNSGSLWELLRKRPRGLLTSISIVSWRQLFRYHS